MATSYFQQYQNVSLSLAGAIQWRFQRYKLNFVAAPSNAGELSNKDLLNALFPDGVPLLCGRIPTLAELLRNNVSSFTMTKLIPVTDELIAQSIRGYEGRQTATRGASHVQRIAC